MLLVQQEDPWANFLHRLQAHGSPTGVPESRASTLFFRMLWNQWKHKHSSHTLTRHAPLGKCKSVGPDNTGLPSSSTLKSTWWFFRSSWKYCTVFWTPAAKTDQHQLHLKLWVLQGDRNICSRSRKSHDMAWAWFPSEALLPSCQDKICFTFSQNIYFSTKTLFSFCKLLLRELSKKLHKLITLFMYLLEKEVFKNKQKPTKQTNTTGPLAPSVFHFMYILIDLLFLSTV